MRFEIYENDDQYDEYGGHRGIHRPNPILIEAERYELRTVGSDYGTTTVVSFYRGDVEIATLFRLPRMIRASNEA